MINVEQGSDAWHQARLGRATASRIADVMAKGRSGQPSSTRANYAAELVVERLTGAQAEHFHNSIMDRGNEVEPQARASYTLTTGLDVSETGFWPHPKIEMSGASPDGLVGNDGLIQIKIPNAATHIATLLNGKIDRRYMLQMQWEMACTGREFCDFVSFDPRLPDEMRLFIQRVPANAETIAEIEEAVAVFLKEVEQTVSALKAKYRAEAA